MQSNNGYGDGYGFGDGNGLGYGSGNGSGSGYGDGYGFGYGDGLSYGDGYGFGDGSGDGNLVGRAGEYDICLLVPWPYIRVGCLCHSVAYWRDHWEEIAASEGVEITTEDVQEIFAQIGKKGCQ